MKLFKWVLLLLLLPLAAHAQTNQLRVGNLTVTNSSTITGNENIVLAATDGSQRGYFLTGPSMTNLPHAFTIGQFDNTGGSRKNLVSRVGYNPSLNVSDYAFYTAHESCYQPMGAGACKSEWYVEFFGVNRANTVRPIQFAVISEGMDILTTDMSFSASNVTLGNSLSPSGAFTFKCLADCYLQAGAATNPSETHLRSTDASGNVLDLMLGQAQLRLDGRNGLSNGAQFTVVNPMGVTGDMIAVYAPTRVFQVDADGHTNSIAGYNLSGATAGNNVHSFNVTEYDVNSVSRRNLVSRMGYNPALASSDHAFYVATESYYKPGAGDAQTEWYVEYFSPDHMTARRPFFFFVPVEGANINAAQPVITGYTSSGSSQVFTITPPYWYFDGTSNTNGSILLIGVHPSATNNSLIINNGADTFTVSPTGVVSAASLKTTGSAGSKKVVCVDTSTGTLYASSTGTDCSN